MSDKSSDIHDAVTDYCENRLGSPKEFPFKTTSRVYKVAGKMYACIAEDRDPRLLSIKLPPEEGLALRAEHPDHIMPGYHLNKQHWNSIVLDGTLDDDFVLALVRQSYDTVVAGLPKKQRPPEPPG
ncbi:MmcQ/YjbR family DNA-binding protein [Actinomadura fulvescens]|uniref:MmcQ/YjbR family DNA-binding protein n=1 Tax=Actinomadura fulvescens TaxID=46160 RepID=A0ABP6C250_9ACTN